MAKPIDSKGKSTLVLDVTGGPSLHEIEHCLCHPPLNWRLQGGLVFHVSVPHINDDDVEDYEPLPVVFVPTAFSRYAEYLCNLGCNLEEDFRRRGSPRLLMCPDFQINNYSTKKRTGEMEISYATYLRLVLMIRDAPF